MELGARGAGRFPGRFDVDLKRRRALPLLKKRRRGRQDAGAGDRRWLGEQSEHFLSTHSEESRERCKGAYSQQRRTPSLKKKELIEDLISRHVRRSRSKFIGKVTSGLKIKRK